jgi:hypothetical protein
MASQPWKISISVGDLINANPNLQKGRSPWDKVLDKVQVRIDGRTAAVKEGGPPNRITMLFPPELDGKRGSIVATDKDDQILAILNYEDKKLITQEDNVPKEELSRAVTTYFVQLAKETIQKEGEELSGLLTNFAKIFVKIMRDELDNTKPDPTASNEPPAS